MLVKILPEAPTFKDAITEAERQMKSGDLGSLVEFPVAHHFSKGLYSRTILIKAGECLTGKIHTTEHLCIMYGDLEIASEQGRERLTGYNILNSKPGIKRIGYAYTDTLFTTLHVTDELDVDKLESMLGLARYEDYDNFDYQTFLIETDMDQNDVDAIVKNETDLVPMPKGFDDYHIQDSPIHGLGAFASDHLAAGCSVGPARIGDNRTPLGRYVNHSASPNCVMVKVAESNDMVLMTQQSVRMGTELTVDYRQVMRARQ